MKVRLLGAALAAMVAWTPATAAVFISGQVEGTQRDLRPCPDLLPCVTVSPVAFAVTATISDEEAASGSFSISRLGGPLREFTLTGRLDTIGSSLFGRDLSLLALQGGLNSETVIRASAATFSATRIAGQANIGQVTFQAVSPVPEPATWATMLIGFGAIGTSLRRRGRARRVALAA